LLEWMRDAECGGVCSDSMMLCCVVLCVRVCVRVCMCLGMSFCVIIGREATRAVEALLRLMEHAFTSRR
jgi:hypothetical protein